ncbi:MAG: AAA family ATPase, partial [Actinobacteria bacterium]|nr:AAA family ATPase [Actinomycetota bacterium]
ERNDSELVDAFLRRYYDAARRVVESYGGSVEKYIGDAVVAVFGVPTLHEDDPERAVRAGLRLVDEIDALPGIGGQPLEVRVGVNTGEALVRLDVDPASGKGFLTGDAVNVAARLQAAAPPMAVAVGAATHAATAQVFAYDACHPVTLKGKSKPLRAWIATAPLARTGSELRSFSSAFVGREEELAELQTLLDEAAADGRLRCALLVGEPGIGKSRLLAELARRLDDQPTFVTWRQGRCLPFGANVTFWALSEIVRSCAGVLESDGVARAEARLETVLPEGPDRDRLRSRLRPLLGLEAEEASREENFAAWRAFLEGRAADGPAIVVIEDLHWADEAMLAFMDYLAGSEASAPLLLLASTRPEVLELAGPGASFVAAATHLPLGPLSGEETAELARARLGAKSLPTDLQALILERSGGNPLFAEELVRLLQDRGLLEERSGRIALRPGAEVPLPDSIGALIAARLDLLAPERKALLADASVVGRTFWVGAVAAVGAREAAAVYEGVIELVAKELVRPERSSSMEGDTEFLFVHALVCDVAYAQLTHADRAAKHAALARWLEERTAGRTEDLAEVLAFHYGTALEMATAAGLFDLEDELAEPTERYLSLAGGRAAPLDPAAAAAHFARAERVADEAARPKRRFFLSRRTRRTLKRRAPLLVAAAAVIVVALVAALAVLEFRPTHGKPSGPVQLTAQQIADRYGDSIVDVSARVRVADKQHRIVWKTVHQSGVVASKDGFIHTSDARLARLPVLVVPEVVTVGIYSHGSYRTVPGYRIHDDSSHSVTLIKVDPRQVDLQPMPQGDSESVRKGDRVVCLSRLPESGILLTSTGTIVSTQGGTTSVETYSDNGLDLFTGAEFRVCYMVASSPTKSPRGGALVDKTGHIVGVMGPWYRLPDEPSSVPPTLASPGAAVAGSVYRGMIDNAQRGMRADLPVTLGIDRIDYLTPQVTGTKLARSFGLDGQRGILIEGVMPGSPVAEAGLRGARQLLKVNGKWVQADGSWYGIGGDIMLALDGTPTYQREDVDAFLRHATPGSVVAMRVLRLRTDAARQMAEGPHSQRWLVRHYWRPVTLKVVLGSATPVSWNW